MGMYGLSVEKNSDVVLRSLIGFSVETIENLFIRVKDAQGILIPCSIIIIQGGEIAGIYNANPLNIYVQASANLEIQAQARFHQEQTQTISHQGDGFYKTVDFLMQFSGYAQIIRRA